MPTYYARKSGNVNATDVWATTPTGTAAAVTFAAGDVLVANSFTVTVNVSTDLGSTGQVRNDTTGGATAGGSFSLSNGVTLTANVFASSVSCVTTSGAVSAAIVGNITGGTSNYISGVTHNSSGTLTVTGTAIVGTGIGTNAILSQSPGTLVFTGNAVGGSVGSGLGHTPLLVYGYATITGNLTGGSVASACGLQNWGTSPCAVTGTVTGGTASGAVGALNGTTGSIAIVGTCVGGSAGAGATNNSSGTLTATRAKGGALASAAVGVAASTNGSTLVEEIEYGDLGASPVSGPIRLSDKSSNVAVMYRFGTTKKTLTDPNATGLMPSAANVRFGTVYNGGNSTGTMRVPAAGSVALGVPVDNTTGTAALTPAAVWDYLTSAATTSGSMGERLKDAATVASTGQQLANALTP